MAGLHHWRDVVEFVMSEYCWTGQRKPVRVSIDEYVDILASVEPEMLLDTREWAGSGGLRICCVDVLVDDSPTP